MQQQRADFHPFPIGSGEDASPGLRGYNERMFLMSECHRGKAPVEARMYP